LDENEGGFDLIVTDLRMPVLKGQSILRAVKYALPEVPVIVMTAFGSPEIETECLDKGAAAFLEKPLDTPQLLAAIGRVLSTPEPARKWGLRRPRVLRKPKAPPSQDQTAFLSSTALAHGSGS
jgi:DNA-binding NtrC family response regulator